MGQDDLLFGFESTLNKTKTLVRGEDEQFDWRLNGIQQLGLVLSRRFSSVDDSFEEIANHKNRITFEDFTMYAEKSRALSGFNLTHSLLKQLFGYLDPHKKGYLTRNDWANIFTGYKWHEQCLSELKNLISSNFGDCEGAFEFFISLKKEQKKEKGGRRIHKPEFVKAVTSLSGKRFSSEDLETLWSKCCPPFVQSIDEIQFRAIFDQLRFSGKSTIRSMRSTSGKSFSTFSMSSDWGTNIIEKLRFILKSSNLSLREAFVKIDKDGNGFLSQIEFRNAVRQLNLGLTSREIDQLLNKIDSNSDGKIDWREFSSKFTPK